MANLLLLASIVINNLLALQTDILYLNVYLIRYFPFCTYLVYFSSTYFLEGLKCTNVITSFSLNKVIVLYCC